MLDFLRFYNRPQKYKAEIRVNVRNSGTRKKHVSLIVPLPMTTDYQKTTPIFKDRIISFDLTLQAGEKETVSVVFEAQVLPRKHIAKIAPEITRANKFVMEYLTYGNAIDGLYTAEEAREKRIVDCGGFDTLLQDELKKEGIDSKVVAGFWSDGGMHAWLEIDGEIPADPSIEYLKKRGRTKKSGQLGFVGSDRIAFSEWKPGDEFLQKPFLKTADDDIKHENYFYCTRA